MIVEIIHQTNVDAVWPIIATKIGSCIDRFGGDASAGDLWTMCRAGHVFLIVASDNQEIKAASIWRSETWADGVVLRNLITVGEDMHSWLKQIDQAAHDLAICCGASSYVWQGRKGWERIFKDKTMTVQSLYRVEV